MLDGKKRERPPGFGRNGLLSFQTRQIVHPDNRRDGLPASLDDDMLSAMLHFPDESGEVRLRFTSTDTLRTHRLAPTRTDQQVGSTDCTIRHAFQVR